LIKQEIEKTKPQVYMRNLINFIPFLLSLFYSCRDESNVNVDCFADCITIEGKVLSGENPQVWVSGVSLELGWNKPGTPLPDFGRLIATDNSDSEGNFSFTFLPKERELEEGQFYIQTIKPEFFDSFNGYYFIDKSDTTYIKNVHIGKKTGISLILKNFEPISEGDSFSVYGRFNRSREFSEPIDFFDSNGNEISTSMHSSQNGPSEIIAIGQTATNQWTHFLITKKKNGNFENYRDSIFVTSDEIPVFEVEY